MSQESRMNNRDVYDELSETKEQLVLVRMELSVAMRELHMYRGLMGQLESLMKLYTEGKRSL